MPRHLPSRNDRDTLDAVELGEALEFVCDWLETTSPAVRADLDAFVGADGYSVEILADLRCLSQSAAKGDRPMDRLGPRQRSPSRNDDITIPCPCCGRKFASVGRRRWCSDACRQAAHRRRHQPEQAPADLPARRPRKPGTVYACPTCDQRYLGEQYCPDCNTFCYRIGFGGACPSCDEPVAHDELLST